MSLVIGRPGESSNAGCAARRSPRADAHAGQVWKRFLMRRPRLTLGERPARPGSARFRGPVLDAVGAVLLWSVMAVDLATRPLAAGPVSVDARRLPAGRRDLPARSRSTDGSRWSAIVVSDLALVAYAIEPVQRIPRVRHLRSGVRGRPARGSASGPLVVYLAGVVGLIVALALQPAGVATASSWISTILTVTVAWLAGENLRSLPRTASARARGGPAPRPAAGGRGPPGGQ